MPKAKETVLAALLVVTGCATVPDETGNSERSRYRRETAHIEAREDYERLIRACARAGGTMHMHRTSSGRLAPTTAELRMASCGPRVTF
jgi:starvation-inducible outer membrane lipoprotein